MKFILFIKQKQLVLTKIRFKFKKSNFICIKKPGNFCPVYSSLKEVNSEE
jgi:competence protein ComGF